MAVFDDKMGRVLGEALGASHHDDRPVSLRGDGQEDDHAGMSGHPAEHRCRVAIALDGCRFRLVVAPTCPDRGFFERLRAGLSYGIVLRPVVEDVLAVVRRGHGQDETESYIPAVCLVGSPGEGQEPPSGGIDPHRDVPSLRDVGHDASLPSSSSCRGMSSTGQCE